jgi:hypothetical protein
MALRYNEWLAAKRLLQIILGSPGAQDLLCASFVSFVALWLKVVNCLLNLRAYEYHHKVTKSTKNDDYY